MRYTVECDLRNFHAWSGAVDTLNTLIQYDDVDQVENYICEVFGEEDPTDTEINDLLWFETDAIAEYLGFQTWEHYEDPNKYVQNEVIDNISEEDLALFEKENGDLYDYIYKNYSDEELQNVGEVIDEIEDLIEELKERDDNDNDNQD